MSMYMYRHSYICPFCLQSVTPWWIPSPGVALARFLNDVWRSDDGLTWRRVAVGALWAPRAAAATAVVRGVTVVVAGGRGEEGCLG